mmetsp:Transcript_92491/g.265084  ORF Transcript_92491/g.265084 Transcript_92491/m.265084 type:complete len:323 (-) Transcript_92491:993-1961(-)
MKFMNVSLGIEPSSSSSSFARSLLSSPSVGASSSSAGSFLSSPSSFFSALGSFSQDTKKAKNSFSLTLSSLSVSTAAKRSSFFKLFAFWWYLSIFFAFFSMAPSSSAAFFLASSRHFEAKRLALVMRMSKRPILNSNFFCSPITHTLSSASMPSLSAVTTFLASAEASFASLISSSAPVASSTVSSAEASFAFVASPWQSSSAFATLPSAISTSLPTSAIFSVSSSLSLARRFSFSIRSALRFSSLACSRATPTAILSLWKSAFLTPLSEPTTTLKSSSTTALGRSNLYSPLAYFSTSLRLRKPSVSPSYFLKITSKAWTFF